MVDGLALGGMAQLLEEQAGRLNLVGLVHHPLAMETGLDEDSAERLRVAERRALASVHRVIVTSPATAKILTAYGVGDGRIEVVSPGTTRVSRAKGGNKNLLNLLCVATLIPRKGHMTLLEALSQLTDRPWSLRCIGSPERSPSTARAVSAEVIRLGLEKRVSLQGEMDTTLLNQRYMEADVFVLALIHGRIRNGAFRGFIIWVADCQHHRRRHSGYGAVAGGCIGFLPVTVKRCKRRCET